MTFQSNVGVAIQTSIGEFEAAKAKASNLVDSLQKPTSEFQGFDAELNKNFPKQDELIAQFDQDCTVKIFDFKQKMLELRVSMPKPEPPIKPICAVWPGVPGGSKGF